MNSILDIESADTRKHKRRNYELDWIGAKMIRNPIQVFKNDWQSNPILKKCVQSGLPQSSNPIQQQPCRQVRMLVLAPPSVAGFYRTILRVPHTQLYNNYRHAVSIYLWWLLAWATLQFSNISALPRPLVYTRFSFELHPRASRGLYCSGCHFEVAVCHEFLVSLKQNMDDPHDQIEENRL
jgi:hypothetical protein